MTLINRKGYPTHPYKRRPTEHEKSKQTKQSKMITKHEQRKRKQRQKHLAYATERKTLINMENGMRTLRISSLNPDSVKEEQAHRDIMKKPKKKQEPYCLHKSNTYRAISNLPTGKLQSRYRGIQKE